MSINTQMTHITEKPKGFRKANGLTTDLSKNEPFRKVDVCAIITTWEGEARNKNHAEELAQHSWNARNWRT